MAVQFGVRGRAIDAAYRASHCFQGRDGLRCYLDALHICVSVFFFFQLDVKMQMCSRAEGPP